jgi:hypothetical protein
MILKHIALFIILFALVSGAKYDKLNLVLTSGFWDPYSAKQVSIDPFDKTKVLVTDNNNDLWYYKLNGNNFEEL